MKIKNIPGDVVVSVLASHAPDPGAITTIGSTILTGTSLVNLVPGKCDKYY